MSSLNPITEAILSVTGDEPITNQFSRQLHEPFYTTDDMARVSRCDPTGYREIGELEGLVAECTGRKYAVGVSSGTAALHLALLAVGVRPRSGVLMPAMEFAGAAAAVRYCGAEMALYDKTPTGGLYAATVAVDLLGHPCRQLPVLSLGPTILDAAQSLGSTIDGKPSASRGDIAIVSFNHNKIVTCGGGGMVLTDDAAVAKEVRHLATTAKLPDAFFYNHDRVGYNYRMSNMGAALALGQMGRLSETIERKRDLAERYGKALAGLAPLIAEPAGTRSNYWLTAISVPPSQRDTIMMELASKRISTRALYTPLHMQKPYEKSVIVDDLSGAVALWNTTICLPSGSDVC